ncbi:MAG: nitroreductase family protein [Sedimentisphaerales bacterium]|nr:nitroreductase family protein [Sedimentisphaerales bacterium]
MFKDLILRNRSYRRFDPTGIINEAALRELVELARCSASAANLQPLKYKLTNDAGLCAKVFETLAWAGYLTDWSGPAENERPTAYITILTDTNIAKKSEWDQGIAAQSILLGAVEKGFGGCMVGSIKRESLAKILDLPGHLEIGLVIALGKPTEEVVLEDADDSIKYYRDQESVHHVPKRKLDDVIV